MSTDRIAEIRYGPRRYTAMDAVNGLALRMREDCMKRGGSVFTTIGRDRIESYVLALEAAVKLLTREESAREVIQGLRNRPDRNSDDAARRWLKGEG